MTTTRLLFEEETGSSTGRRHPHNGYYAGDLSGRTDAPEAPFPLSKRPLLWPLLGTAFDTEFAVRMPGKRTA